MKLLRHPTRKGKLRNCLSFSFSFSNFTILPYRKSLSAGTPSRLLEEIILGTDDDGNRGGSDPFTKLMEMCRSEAPMA